MILPINCLVRDVYCLSRARSLEKLSKNRVYASFDSFRKGWIHSGKFSYE